MYRAVLQKYRDALLSTEGSQRSEHGGRYNFGSIDVTKFNAFPALYIARDENTARSEFYKRKMKRAQESAERYDEQPGALQQCYVGRLQFERNLVM